MWYVIFGISLIWCMVYGMWYMVYSMIFMYVYIYMLYEVYIHQDPTKHGFWYPAKPWNQNVRSSRSCGLLDTYSLAFELSSRSRGRRQVPYRAWQLRAYNERAFSLKPCFFADPRFELVRAKTGAMRPDSGGKHRNWEPGHEKPQGLGHHSKLRAHFGGLRWKRPLHSGSQT